MYLAPLKYSGLAASGKHSAGAMKELGVIKHSPPPWPAPNLPNKPQCDKQWEDAADAVLGHPTEANGQSVH